MSTRRHSRDPGAGGHLLSAVDVRHLAGHLGRGQHETGVWVVDRRTEHHAENVALEVDQRSARITLPYRASDRIHLALHRSGAIDVRAVELDDVPDAGGRGD